MKLPASIRRLARHSSGVAMTEFALGLPIMLTAGMWGIEEANYALVNMKIGQLASQIADNASRVGDPSMLQERKIYESDINDLLLGAQIQGGKGIDLYNRGRVFISSLEVNPANSRQYIHWQRCRGSKRVTSSYGAEGYGLASVIPGMGPAGREVIAQPGGAVIFVEINYTYKPLISERFLGTPDIKSIAAFTVRDSRDLNQIYQQVAASPDEVQACTNYEGAMAVSSNGSVG